ncbi:MAG: hypothetical protein Q4G36_12140 [Paracoccus sp. (in: a-proteobacteria)]|nr:hypothetical protein [Paracoccus sp. (in: a-proteobacteria)]
MIRKAILAAFCAAALFGQAQAQEAGLSPGAALIFADRAPWTPPEGGYVWATERPRDGVQVDTDIVLTAYTDTDGGAMLLLSERRDGEERALTRFPVSAGDPVVVFFLETVARDMATITGGSPFYIRNRMKEAVAQGGEVTAGDDTVVVLRPFGADPNDGRMFGFDKLALRFDLGADPAAPIRHLRAEAPAEDGGPGYVFDMQMEDAP